MHPIMLRTRQAAIGAAMATARVEIDDYCASCDETASVRTVSILLDICVILVLSEA